MQAAVPFLVFLFPCLLWGTLHLAKDVGALAVVGFFVPFLFTLGIPPWETPLRTRLPHQSWTLAVIAPFLGWTAAVVATKAMLVWPDQQHMAGLVGVLFGVSAAGLAHIGHIGRRLAAPVLDGTAERAAADIGLAYAVHGVEPCDVLVAMDGDSVFYLPPARRSQDQALHRALEWAAARTNARQVGRRWPPVWEQFSRMDAITRQSAQMLHLVNGRWGANRPSLSPTAPSAHALLAAVAGTNHRPKKTTF